MWSTQKKRKEKNAHVKNMTSLSLPDEVKNIVIAHGTTLYVHLCTTLYVSDVNNRMLMKFDI